MRLVEFGSVDLEAVGDGPRSVLINPDHVLLIAKVNDGNVYVQLTHGETAYVKGTVGEVANKLRGDTRNT